LGGRVQGGCGCDQQRQALRPASLEDAGQRHRCSMLDAGGLAQPRWWPISDQNLPLVQLYWAQLQQCAQLQRRGRGEAAPGRLARAAASWISCSRFSYG
jgi:hypothetical protein